MLSLHVAVVLCVNSSNVAFAQLSFVSNLADEILIFRNDCLSAVLREGDRAVVHDGLIVVRRSVVVEHVRVHTIKLFEEARIDVLPQNLHILVAVRSIVHVNESQSVKQLMDDDSLSQALFPVQR